jgi:hypothetical protein
MPDTAVSSLIASVAADGEMPIIDAAALILGYGDEVSKLTECDRGHEPMRSMERLKVLSASLQLIHEAYFCTAASLLVEDRSVLSRSSIVKCKFTNDWPRHHSC